MSTEIYIADARRLPHSVRDQLKKNANLGTGPHRRTDPWDSAYKIAEVSSAGTGKGLKFTINVPQGQYKKLNGNIPLRHAGYIDNANITNIGYLTRVILRTGSPVTFDYRKRGRFGEFARKKAK